MSNDDHQKDSTNNNNNNIDNDSATRSGTAASPGTNASTTSNSGRNNNNSTDQTHHHHHHHISRKMRMFVNDNDKNIDFEYPDNGIQTSKYTLLTFLPLFLQQQYKKASNIFILFVCILTFIPGVAALGPAASLFPVIFVLLVAGLKDGYEDYKRHKADKQANSIEVRVLRGGEWDKLPSCDVQCGDICLYEHGDEIRADSVVLATSNDDNVAFIETANLDGETTVKIRRAPQFCSQYLGNENDIMAATASPGVVILAAEPDPALGRFKGAIHIGGPECRRAASSAENDDQEGEESSGGSDKSKNSAVGRFRRNNNSNKRKRSSSSNKKKEAKTNNSEVPSSSVSVTSSNQQKQPVLTSANNKNNNNEDSSINKNDQTFSTMNASTLRDKNMMSSTIQIEDNTNNNNNNDDNNNEESSSQAQSGTEKQEETVFLRSGLDLKHFLYRGSMLRNTEWCLCVAVYTGINTKMFLNLQQAPPRMSSMDGAINKLLLVLIGVHQVFVLVISGLAVWWSGSSPDFWYLKNTRFSKNDLGATFLFRYLGYFVLLSFILPASLFVTVEVAKAMQAVFMSWDHGMATFHVATSQWLFCRPKTSTLNEQLALVRYVFTDKTGTLTQNQMNVVKICHDDVELDDEDGKIGKVIAAQHQKIVALMSARSAENSAAASPNHNLLMTNNNNNRRNSHSNSMRSSTGTLPPSSSSKKENNNNNNNADINHETSVTSIHSLDDTITENNKNNRKMNTSDYLSSPNDAISYLKELRQDKLHLLLLNMALCHSVVCFDNPSHPLLKIYEGPSQDELALTSSARRNGYALFNRTSQGMELTLAQSQVNVVFDLLAEMEFSSERQMMSVLVRDGTTSTVTKKNHHHHHHHHHHKSSHGVNTVEDDDDDDERFILFSKGADSAMFNRAAHHAANKKAIGDITTQLEGLCSMGLRTLVFGYRIISSAEKNEWMEKFDAAKCAMENRTEKIAAASSLIEKNFEILGVVGIEDKLQDAVPETLHFLKQTGITIWMLTGDKRETAVAIGETSKLLDPSTDLIAHLDVTEIAEDDFTPVEEVRARLAEQIQLITKEREKDEHRDRPFVLVVDGVSLKVALEDENAFMDLVIHCKSAVCCRLSPLLKAELVRLFQARTGATVLAIGDGANDVSMIQASMVGIGIMGLEGSQAELSSAYAIPQFKNLKRLLVVHGRYCWYRTTTCLIYTIFKNAALSLCLIYYSFYSGFSSATLFDSWLLTMFNTFFTQATPWIMGGVDTDVDDDILMESPELYKFIRIDGEYFNARTFTMWTVDTIITSVSVYFICLTTMNADDMGEYTGYSLDHYGTMAFLVLLVIVDSYALITQQIYSTVTGFVVLLNWSIIPILMFIYSAIPVDSSFNYTGVPVEVLQSKLFYIYAWVVNALTVLSLRVSFTRLFKRFWPSANEVAVKKRVEEKAKRLEQEEKEKKKKRIENEGVVRNHDVKNVVVVNGDESNRQAETK